MARSIGVCKAVMIESLESTPSKSYRIINEKMIAQSIEGASVAITKLVDGDNTVFEINSGKQVLNGSNIAVEAAYENYKKIYHSIEEGGASTHELEMAFLDGAAIDESMIDESLDNRLTLATSCATYGVKASSIELKNLAIESAKKSIVMLKNEGILPLDRGLNVALIGDVVSNTSQYLNFVDNFKKALGNEDVNVTGYEQGYNIDEDKSEGLIYPAVRLAESSDAVILFLGLGKERENELHKTHRLQLPANQKALISELKKTRRKIIAVICGSRLPNMSFDDDISAVLLAPAEGIGVPFALSEILVGSYNPTGRLAYAGYSNMDARFREIQTRKRMDKQKIGHFIGYRYTDGCDMEAKYPFGYGISYTSFAYSSLNVRSNSITFSVHNVGEVAGVETVQVYAGINKSSTVRPLKELRAICRVALKPHERKTIEVSLNDLKIYDTDSKRFVNEAGDYTIFVGSSASDIHLTGRIYVYGETLHKKNQHLSEYLYEVSNIHSERYTMEAYCKPMNDVSKIKSAGLWLLAISIFFDMIYGICGLLGMPIKEHTALFITITAIGLLASIVCLLVYHKKNKAILKEQAEKERIATNELFKNAEKIDVDAVEKLFVEEFDIPEKKQQQQKKTTSSYMGKDESMYVYMSVDTDFANLCKDMVDYLGERGLGVSLATCRAVVSSMMSSRLLVFRHKDSSKAKDFVEHLARFFGTESHIESLADVIWEKSTLLYSVKSEYGSPTQTQLQQAFTTALSSDLKASFYAMTDVTLSDTASFMMPYIQFLGNPMAEHTVSEKGYDFTIPTNMWFVIIPKDGEYIDQIPAFVSNHAAVIDLETQDTESTIATITPKSINTHQLEALLYRSKKSASIDENTWKTVDALESFVNERTPYHIGNKIFLQLESYLSVYLASGGQIEEALDGAISSKLLPAILAILYGNVDMNEIDFPHALESIFGEENVLRSSNMVKSVRRLTQTSKQENEQEDIVASQQETAHKVDLSKESHAKVQLKKPTDD